MPYPECPVGRHSVCTHQINEYEIELLEIISKLSRGQLFGEGWHQCNQFLLTHDSLFR